MNARPRFKKALTAVLVLVIVSSTVAAATTLSTFEDGPEYGVEWDQSTYSGGLAQDNYNSTSDPIQLGYNDLSESEGSFEDWENQGDDTAETSSDIHLQRGTSAGDRSWTGGSVRESRTTPGSAYANGHLWFLGDYLHKATPDGFTDFNDGGDKMCDIASNIPGQPRGLARNPGGGIDYELLIAGRDTAALTNNFYEYDVEDCTKSKAGSVSNDGAVRGIAIHESDQTKLYYIDGGNNDIDIIDLDGSQNELNGFLALPNGKQRGLDVHQWPDGTVWFLVSYTGDNGQEELQIIRKSDGNVVKTFTSSTGDTYTAVWNHDKSQKRVFTVDDGNNIFQITPVNLWKGDGEASVKYQHTLGDVPKNDLKVLEWTGEAPAAFKGTGGQLALEAKNTNGNWQTLDTQSAGTGSFSKSVSLGSNFHGVSNLTYRVVVENNYKIRGGNPNPKVTSVSWDYDYYSRNGTVTSIPVDTSKVEEFENLTLNGTSGGQNVDVRILDKDGNVEYSQSDVQPNTTLNTSSIPTDYSTSEVQVQFDLQSDGLSSPGLTGYQAQWLSQTTPPPAITDFYAEVGSLNTTSTDVETGVQSMDQFTIQNVNDTVDTVTWYVDGEAVESSNVSSTGPFSFNRTWDSTGEYTVVGEVENDSTGIDYVEWDVQVYDIAIQGEDSYSKSTGGLITTTQTFEVFTVDNASIDFEVEYNESVVTKVSGPTNGTVANGGSRTWEFQVKQSNYTGSPITITASYGERTSTKKIYVSTASSGGSLIGGGDGVKIDLISNYWMEKILPGFSDQGYLFAQGILAGGFGLLIWLHHFGLVWLPKLVSRRLRKTGRLTKVFITVIGGSLLVGVNLLVWGALSGALGGIYFRYVGTGRTPLDDLGRVYGVVRSL